MKICISTDFHLSYRQYNLEEREKDFYNQYDKMIDAIIREKPSLFLILGDIFDNPYPKPISLKVFEDGLDRLQQENIKTIGILGNHTLVQKKDFYPIDRIFNDKYHILDEDCIITEDNIFIGGIGYRPRTYDIRGAIDNLYEKAKDCKLKILLLHQILKKDQHIGYDYDEEELELNRFDYVFLGHLHKRTTRQMGHTVIHYAGSLNSCNVTELKDEMVYGRGYSVLDTESLELDCIRLPPQREYVEYSLNDDELNGGFIDVSSKSLGEKLAKPIIQLNFIGKPSSDIYTLKKKLEDVSLVVRQNIINEYCNENVYRNEYLDWGDDAIEGLLQSHFDDDWKGKLAVDLFRALRDGDVESARHIAKSVFEEKYGVKNKNI